MKHSGPILLFNDPLKGLKEHCMMQFVVLAKNPKTGKKEEWKFTTKADAIAFRHTLVARDGYQARELKLIQR